MSSIISLVVRSLYSLVAVFFFVFTVQPVVAVTTYDAEIAVLKECVDSEFHWGVRYSLQKLPEGDAALAGRILALRDTAGNSLAHKLVETGDIELLADLFKVCGVAIFEAKNKAGLNSFEAHLESLGSVFRPISTDNYYGDINRAIEVQNKLRPLALRAAPNLVAQYKQYKNDLAVVESGREGLEAAQRGIRDYNSSEARALEDQINKIQEDAYPIRRNLDRSVENLGGFALSFGIQALQGIMPLEQIDDYSFYQMLSYSEEGRKELRTYRTQNGKTLYSYFNENAKNDGRSRIQDELLKLYYGAGIPVPAAVDIDITNSELGWEFFRFLETPEGKNFFEKYRNSQGQNLAFIAANDVNLLQTMKKQGVDVAGMLTATDIHGNDGISQIRDAWRYDKIVSESVFESIKKKVAHRQEKEQEEQDRIWRQEQEEQERLREEAFARGIKVVNAKPFNDGWWHEVISTFNLAGNPQEFASFSLEAILRQNPSPLRSAFLQQNPTDFVSQAQIVNQLWQSFFATYYDLVRQEEQARGHEYGYSRHDDSDETMLARPIRVLNIFGRFGRNGMMGQEPNPAVIETMLTLQSNILATGGTFGMEFNRKANEYEARNMIDILERFGDSALRFKQQSFFETLDQAIKGIGEKNFEEISDFIASHDNSFTGKVTDKKSMREAIMQHIVNPFNLRAADEVAHEIMQRLFKADSKLTIEQRVKLEDHQTNCAVIALRSVFEGRFDEIDKILASRPLMRDKSASYYRRSEQRYEDLMEMTGRYHSSAGGYHSDDNDVDFGEEY